MSGSVHDVIEDLVNAKATLRKKAVDGLPGHFVTEQQRAALSDASWTALVRKAIECAGLELVAAKKARRAPRREVGDLVELCVTWAADGVNGRRLAGCAEHLITYGDEAYGGGCEAWAISYGRVLERVLGEPEAVEAASIALAARGLDGQRIARELCAPAARIARGAFPEPPPPPAERAAARRAAAAALRRLAERGADVADDRYAREALARACAGCLRNLYTADDKLDDEAPAVEIFQALAALHTRAPADAARLALRGRHGLGHVAAECVARLTDPSRGEAGNRTVQSAVFDYVAAAAARAGPGLKKLLPRLARFAANNARARAAANLGAEPQVDRRWPEAPPLRPTLRSHVSLFGALCAARAKPGWPTDDAALVALAEEIKSCARRDDATLKPVVRRDGSGAPELALRASLASTAPPLQLLAAALEAASTCVDAEAIRWDDDAAVVSAAQGVSTDEVLEARRGWCRVLAQCVAAASAALDAPSSGSQRSDERAWSLVALRRLAAASRRALDVADSALLTKAWRPAWRCIAKALGEKRRSRFSQRDLAAAASAAAGCLGLGLVDAQGLSDRQAAAHLWSSPLFSEEGDARTVACACSIVAGFAAKTRLDLSFVGGPDDIVEEDDAMEDDDEEREAGPRNRRQRLVRWACRVVDRCYADDAVATVALARAVDALASLVAPGRNVASLPPRAPQLLGGPDELKDDAWALPAEAVATTSNDEPPHAPGAREAGQLVDEILTKLRASRAAHSQRGQPVLRDRAKRRALQAAKSAARHRNAAALARLRKLRIAGGDVARSRNLDLDLGRALQDLEKAWDYGDEDALVKLATYADCASVLAAVARTIRETGPTHVLATNLASVGAVVQQQCDNYGVARASRDAPVAQVRERDDLMDSDSDDGFIQAPVRTERDSESRIPLRARACAVWLARAALDLSSDAAVGPCAEALAAAYRKVRPRRGPVACMRDRRDAGRVARAIVDRCGASKASRARASALGLLSKCWLAPNHALAAESIGDDDVHAAKRAAPEAFGALGVLLGQLATSRCAIDEVEEITDKVMDLLLVPGDAHSTSPLAVALWRCGAAKAAQVQGAAGAFSTWGPRTGDTAKKLKQQCVRAVVDALVDDAPQCRRAAADGVAALFEAYPTKNHARVWTTLCSHLPSLDRDRDHDAAVCAKKKLMICAGGKISIPADDTTDPERGIGAALSDEEDEGDSRTSANAAHWRALEATAARCVGAVAGVRNGGATDRALGALVRAGTRDDVIASAAGAAVARAARARGLASAAELLRERLGAVVAEWCGIDATTGAATGRTSHTLSEFPFSFCGLAPSTRAFAALAARAAAAPLAAAQDASLRFTAFSTLADLSGYGQDDAGRRHVVANVAPIVVAGVLLRRAAAVEDEKAAVQAARKGAAARMREFLERELGGSERCNEHAGKRVHFVASAILEDGDKERVAKALAELVASDKHARTTPKLLLQRCNATELVLRSTSLMSVGCILKGCNLLDGAPDDGGDAIAIAGVVAASLAHFVRAAPKEPDAVADLLAKVVGRCVATRAGRAALVPLLPCAAVLAGSLANEANEENGGWMRLKRCSVASRDKARKVVEALVLAPHAELAAASGALPRARFSVSGHNSAWDWVTLVGDVHRTDPGPLERPQRVFALASLLKRLRLETVDVSTEALATICACTLNERERSLAAECLGELGGVQGSIEDEQPSLIEDDLRYPPTMAVLRIKACRAAARSLVDDDPGIAAAAMSAMRLLAATAGDDVHRSVEKDAHSQLVVPFLSTVAVQASAIKTADEDQDRAKRKDDINMDDGPFDALKWSTKEARWACRVCAALLGGCDPCDELISACAPLAAVSTNFASLLLPCVVYDVVCLRAGDSKGRRTSRDAARDAISDHLTIILEQAGPERPCAQLACSVVAFCRRCELELFMKSTKEERPRKKAKVDPLTIIASASVPGAALPYGAPLHIAAALVATAASLVDAPWCAVLHGELSRDENGNADRALVKAHALLGDADALNAAQEHVDSDDDEDATLARGRARGTWRNVLSDLDAALTHNKPAVAGALRRLGLHHVANEYIDGASSLGAEAAWRCGDWAWAPSDGATDVDFDGALHGALAAVASRDKHACLTRLENATRLALEPIRRVAVQPSVDDARAKLVAICEVNEAAQVAEDGGGLKPMLERWRGRDASSLGSVGGGAFSSCVEPALAAREASLRALQAALGDDERSSLELDAALLDHLASVVSLASDRNAVGSAVAAAARAKIVCKALQQAGRASHASAPMRVKLLAARVAWSRGESHAALAVARRAVETILPTDKRLRGVRADALQLCGCWAPQNASEPSSKVLEVYLRPAVREMEDRRKALLALGEYVADMHASLVTRSKTPEWRQARRVADDRLRELERLERLYSAVDNVGRKTPRGGHSLTLQDTAEAKKIASETGGREHLWRQLTVLKRECKLDSDQLDALTGRTEAALVEAVEALAGVITHDGNECDDLARRAASTLVSLWLGQPDVERSNEHVMKVVRKATPGRLLAFAPLLYQLSSRLAAHGETFQKTLEALLLRLSEACPAKTVLQLIALANGARVDDGKGSAAFAKNIEGSARVRVARKLLDSLLKSERGDFVNSLNLLSQCYVDLAMADTKKVQERYQTDPVPFSVFKATCGLDTVAKKLLRTEAPPVITALGSSTSSGSDAPSLASFIPSLKLTDTGIHRPKIVSCIGSDGLKRRQLVKGNDDIRQDAVMEQVFDAVNNILGRHRRPRGLRVRTYAIVPLAPQAGVIEWVEHTLPFGMYLAPRSGPKGAHERYFPDDLKHLQCRQRLDAIKHQASATPGSQKSGKRPVDTQARKRRAFDEVCSRFKPAFRFFFLETCSDAKTWLEHRDAYTRSVAANAMVGHVLGIGDRHVQNILIDSQTGEQVHIDFGIAFDQGKTLTMPEVIPFRLSRDVIDGMGCAGTRGAFFSSSVDCMSELRQNYQALTTILDVLIHDPLYRWMLTPGDASRFQRDKEESQSGEQSMVPPDNQAAERALFRVKQKLQGYSDTTHDALSVEGQVTHLIAEATDRDNLCVLFPGWSPWL